MVVKTRLVGIRKADAANRTSNASPVVSICRRTKTGKERGGGAFFKMARKLESRLGKKKIMIARLTTSVAMVGAMVGVARSLTMRGGQKIAKRKLPAPLVVIDPRARIL